MTFNCELPIVFGRGDTLHDAGGTFEVNAADYRGLCINLQSEDIRRSLLYGLSTPLAWNPRLYIRRIDADWYELTLGDVELRLREREVSSFLSMH